MGGHRPPGKISVLSSRAQACYMQNQSSYVARKAPSIVFSTTSLCVQFNHCHCWPVSSAQPTVLQALHMAVLQGKGAEVPKLLQAPLNYLEQSLSKGKTPYLTGVCMALTRPPPSRCSCAGCQPARWRALGQRPLESLVHVCYICSVKKFVMPFFWGGGSSSVCPKAAQARLCCLPQQLQPSSWCIFKNRTSRAEPSCCGVDGGGGHSC